MKTYGLLGKSLGHSFSPAVHAAFGDSAYRLFETPDPLAFLAKGTFDGLNVTIPYKEVVASAVDFRDGIAAATGAVNTIVRADGKLYGYNTDYAGIQATFARHRIDVTGLTVAVIGNGGAAKTAVKYLADAGAAVIDVFCRTPRREGEKPLAEAGGPHDILINATPVGMHPDDDGLPVDPARFPRLRFVFDFVYNPLRTNLTIAAADRGVACANGLYMLVMQARKSRELFTGIDIPAETADKVSRDLLAKQTNVVLIGMPMSGKSMFAGILAGRLGKKMFDTDAAIEARERVTIADIFARWGEAGFRTMEEAVVADMAGECGLIVSTGGGMVKNATAMKRLRRNGVIVFLDKDYHKIMTADIRNRPLIKSPADVERLALERRPLYEKYADITVEVTDRREDVIQEIEAKLHAYFDRQRA